MLPCRADEQPAVRWHLDNYRKPTDKRTLRSPFPERTTFQTVYLQQAAIRPRKLLLADGCAMPLFHADFPQRQVR